MDHAKVDVLVIGGGPGGGAVAIDARRRGWSVAVVDRARHPRFHVGESLLPASLPLLSRLGLDDAIARRAYVVKHGARFVSGDGARAVRFDFANAGLRGPGYAYQVPRADFDLMILEAAQTAGAVVLQDTECTRVLTVGAAGAEVELRTKDGATFRQAARVLVDASGQSAFLARHLGLFEKLPDPVRVACFCHWRGAVRESGDAGGDIIIVPMEDCWFWIIPLAGGLTSVGVVMRHEDFRRLGLTPTAAMDRAIAGAPVVRQVLARAERAVAVHTVGDFAYRATRFCGDGWVIVGDAAYFLDPIFSTGVHVALMSASAAVAGLDRGLRAGQVRGTDFAGYGPRLDRIMRHFMPFIRGFYDAAFRDVLLNPRPLFGVERTVLRFLSGKVDSGWLERIRLRLFLYLVDLRRRGRLSTLPALPRISALRPADTPCAPPG